MCSVPCHAGVRYATLDAALYPLHTGRALSDIPVHGIGSIDVAAYVHRTY